MFENIKRLYLTGKLSEAAVKKAVKKKLITKEQCEEILNSTNDR